MNFCSRVLRLPELRKCMERLHKAAIWCLEWLGKLNCQNTDLYVSLLFLSTSWRSLDRSPKSSFCFAEVIEPVRFKPN